MKDIINNMQKGLSEYSPGANTAVESANKALMAIGVLIILILFFLKWLLGISLSGIKEEM